MRFFLLLGAAFSRCTTEILISTDPKTYTLEVSPENPVCVNASEIGMHFLKGVYDTAWLMHPKGYESEEAILG